MSVKYDHWDMMLVATAASSTAATTTTEGNRIIDIEETGGLEQSQIVLTCGAADKAITLKVMGADEENGTFEKVLEFTTTASTEFMYRERTPLNCPRYLKLQVVTGAAAPTTAVQAMLRFAC